MLHGAAISAALRSCLSSTIWLSVVPEETSELSQPARKVAIGPLLAPPRLEQIRLLSTLAEELRRDGLLAEALTLFQLAKRLLRQPSA